MLILLKNKHNPIKSRKEDSGFALLEAIVSIPILFIIGSVVFLVMTQALGVIQDNGLTTSAGGESQVVMNNARDSKTCYELRSLEGTKVFYKDSNREYKTVVSLTEECEVGKLNEVAVVAEKKSDSKILFRTSTEVLITE